MTAVEDLVNLQKPVNRDETSGGKDEGGTRYAWVIYTEAWLLRDVMQTKGWVTLGWGCFRLRIKE